MPLKINQFFHKISVKSGLGYYYNVYVKNFPWDSVLSLNFTSVELLSTNFKIYWKTTAALYNIIYILKSFIITQ